MDPSSHLHGSRGPRPSFPRAPSRASTSTVNTRATSQSAQSLSSVSTSPQLSSSHVAHRFHHAACAPSSSESRLTPRHTPQLSREVSMESTRQSAASSFLQERLQRERRAEGDRLGHPTAIGRTNIDMSASVELGRVAPESPMRGADMGSPRPKSSGGASGGAEPPKKQSLGLMEMEQVLSKLHKQNFDLKLELYHRREKQTGLENQVETLESDRREMEQINDNLLEELDKRDKAIEEAVAMIVTLEARVEQLVNERNMVQQIDREGYFYSQDFNVKFQDPTIPELCVPKRPARAQGDDTKSIKSINRMPSFLSEKTENTENLRDVYLGVLGSALSLQKVTEAEAEAEPEQAHATGLASPTLSVLSESSFMSVYGKKEEADGFPPPIDQPLSLDGADPVESGVFAPEVLRGMAKGKMPGRSASAIPFSRGSNAGSFSLSSGHFGHGPAAQHHHHHHQQQQQQHPIERPSTTRSDGKRAPQPPPLQIGSPARHTMKQGTREALKKVNAEAHGGVRLHEQGFPPTPDTMSTPGLDQLRGSNDSFINLQAHRIQEQSSAGRSSFDSEKSDQQQSSGAPLGERPSQATFSPFEKKFKKDSKDALRGVFLRRSNTKRENAKLRNVIPEEDRVESDDDSDTRSLRSSMDIWMRESSKPAKRGSGSTSGQLSPDLFGFPSSPLKSAWVPPEAVFGTTGPRPGQQGIGYDAAYMQDLLSLRHALFAANVTPTLPDRRSSLAQTSSRSASPRFAPGQLAPEADPKARHLRGSSDPQAVLQTPMQKQAHTQPGNEKKNHYPPITGQQGGARAGLHRLFRRSTGDNLAANGGYRSGNLSASASEKSLTEAPKLTPVNSGVPLWIKGALVGGDEIDRSGATPPPILANPRQRRRNTAGAEMMPANLQLQIPGREPMGDIPETPVEQKRSAPGTPSGTGIRRKWLPAFSRTGSNRRA